MKSFKQFVEEIEQIEEISGKLIGSYIGAARKENAAKYQRARDLDADPKVVAAHRTIGILHGLRTRDSMFRKEMDDARTEIVTRKKKIDPEYPKSTQTGKREEGIRKAIDKLQFGKLS